MRVAIFQYGWPLQSHASNLVRALSARGHEVDLYLKDCSAQLVDAAALARLPGTAVHDLTARRTGARWLDRARERMGGVSGRVLGIGPGAAHDLYVGIEKRGLVWAGRLAERTGAPYVYSSLELYDDTHPARSEIAGFRRLRGLERRYHARAAATIVQDRARGEWLLRSNGLPADHSLLLLPVSVEGEPIRARGSWLRERLGIPAGRRIVLYLGLLDERRGCVEMARQASALGDAFALVFHGYGRPGHVRKIVAAGAVHLSSALVPAEQLPELVASADVGLAFYRPGIANDELTAFSSEKVALYCRAGVPFVARDNESYRSLVGAFRCAELVAGPEAMAPAIRAICAEHAAYQGEAWRAFAAHYRFETHAEALVAGLQALQVRRSGSSRSTTSSTPRA